MSAVNRPRAAIRATAGLLAVAVTLLAETTPAAARQRPATGGNPDLVRIDSLIDAGRLDDARRALRQWSERHSSAGVRVAGSDRAHAFLLQSRLATDWPTAEEALVAIALGYPLSNDAPEALLRLGQGLLTSAAAGARPDDARRATAYLERLARDYPITSLRAAAFLWLARAYAFRGQIDAACARLAEAGRIATDAGTSSLITDEQRLLCRA